MKPYIQFDQPEKGSALDFSGLNCHEAGAKGFVKSKDGRLVFENGERVRFFGVNLGYTAALCSHEEAEKTAEDLLRSGINMVRIHHVDGNYPAALLTYEGTSQELNAEYFDRLDYLAYQLKIRGIYLHIDLCTRRTYLTGDGFSEEEIKQLVHFIKSVQHYDRRIIDLQKKFIRDYLYHINPYTGLRYIDDPAVAIVQYINENAVFWDNPGTRPPIFAKALDNRFNAWLLEKYGTREALNNAWTNDRGEKALGPDEDPASGTVIRPPLGNWKEPRADFNADYTGQESTARHADHMEFLSDTQERTVDEILRYFDELDVKCVRNYSNLPNGPADLRLIAKGDITEHNAYWNHPQGGFMPPVRFHMTEMCKTDITKPGIDFENHTAAAVCTGAVSGKPFLVSEWCPCYPTAFRADQLMQTACYGAFQDWDGLLLFAYTQPQPGETPIRSFFDLRSDPAVWSFVGQAASIFRKGLVSPGKNLVETGLTVDDCMHCTADYGVRPRDAFYVSRMRMSIIEDGVYNGKADAVLSSGHLPSGDYTGANHALLYSATPYANGYQKEQVSDTWANSQVNGKTHLYGNGYKDFQHAMRQWELIPEGCGYVNGAVISDTKEINFDYTSGVFNVCAPTFRFSAGYLPAETKWGKLKLTHINKKAALLLFALDGSPVDESNDLLLTLMGCAENSRMEWDGDTLLAAGEGPVLYDDIQGEITLPKGCKLYALTPEGKPAEHAANNGKFHIAGHINYRIITLK